MVPERQGLAVTKQSPHVPYRRERNTYIFWRVNTGSFLSCLEFRLLFEASSTLFLIACFLLHGEGLYRFLREWNRLIVLVTQVVQLSRYDVEVIDVSIHAWTNWGLDESRGCIDEDGHSSPSQF